MCDSVRLLYLLYFTYASQSGWTPGPSSPSTRCPRVHKLSLSPSSVTVALLFGVARSRVPRFRSLSPPVVEAKPCSAREACSVWAAPPPRSPNKWCIAYNAEMEDGELSRTGYCSTRASGPARHARRGLVVSTTPYRRYVDGGVGAKKPETVCIERGCFCSSKIFELRGLNESARARSSVLARKQTYKVL